jgi:hypothetical protein
MGDSDQRSDRATVTIHPTNAPEMFTPWLFPAVATSGSIAC